MTTLLNISEWIKSPEIRNYVQENHTLSCKQKVEIISGACRPIEEKYEALKQISTATKDKRNQEFIQLLLNLYDKAFEELRNNQPSDVFVWMNQSPHTFDDILNARTRGIDRILRTFDELQDAICFFGDTFSYPFSTTAYIEKWSLLNGKMQCTMTLRICADNGQGFIDRFNLPLEHCKVRETNDIGGICDSFTGFQPFISHSPRISSTAPRIDLEVLRTHCGECRTTVPLPFKNGDLVRIDIPVLDKPVYGVLEVCKAIERHMHLTFIEDGYMKTINMSYQDIGELSQWSVIDWMHPAQPFELPEINQLLVELSEYMKNNDTNQEAYEKIEQVFLRQSIALSKQQFTLEDLFDDTSAWMRETFYST